MFFLTSGSCKLKYFYSIFLFPCDTPSYLSLCTPLSVLTILPVQPGRSFNVTRFTKESLNLPLYVPVHYAHLFFTPTQYPDESSLGPFDPKPPRSPVHLMHEGKITSDHDLRYRGLVSLGRNGTVNEVIIARLSSRHNGVYEIRDGDGNLVSSTFLQVIGQWQDTFKCYLFVSKFSQPLVCDICLICASTVHREKQMACNSQVHHCSFWHVCVTGWFHLVHEALPELQPLADHYWP